MLLLLSLLLPQADLIEKLRSASIEEREQAARRLRERGPDVLPELDRLAEDPDPEVRATAAALARQVRLALSLTPKLRRALPGVELRLAAGDLRRWTEAFLEAVAELQTQEGSGWRFEAKHPGLGRRDLRLLAGAALRGASTYEEKYAIGLAVQSKRIREAAPAVADLLRDTEEELRELAAVVLGDLGAGEEALRRALGDASARVSQEAAVALGRLGDRGQLPRLLALIADPACDGNCLRPRRAARALERLAAQEAIPTLLPLLRHAEWHVRVHGAAALGALGAEAAVPDLIRLTKDESGNVVSAAWGALAAIRNGEAVKALLEELGADSRVNAAYWAGSLGAPEARPRLLRLLQDPDDGVRGNAAASLAALAGTKAVEALRPLLNDAHPGPRSIAADELARLGGSEALPVCRSGLKSGDYWTRLNAATALVFLGEREGVPSVLAEAESLLCLNAMRRPTEWARLRERRMPRETLHGSPLAVLRALAARAGLALDVGAEARAELEALFFPRSGLPTGATLAKTLEDVEHGLRGAAHLVVEGDRLRVLSCEEGHAFWEAWWRSQR